MSNLEGDVRNAAKQTGSLNTFAKGGIMRGDEHITTSDPHLLDLGAWGLDKPVNPQVKFVKDLDRVLADIRSLLIEKNRKYGDSALSPSRVFSRSDAVEQIKVRIDDKLTRLKNQQGDEDEDVSKDLLGYLIILSIAELRASEQV